MSGERDEQREPGPGTLRNDEDPPDGGDGAAVFVDEDDEAHEPVYCMCGCGPINGYA